MRDYRRVVERTTHLQIAFEQHTLEMEVTSLGAAFVFQLECTLPYFPVLIRDLAAH